MSQVAERHKNPGCFLTLMLPGALLSSGLIAGLIAWLG